MGERIAEEFNMGLNQQIEVTKVAELSFAYGKVGERHQLADAEAEAAFADRLGAHTSEVTKPNTADCIDERVTLRLADGTDDPDLLKTRVVYQLPGGEGLAATKALVAANAAIIQGTKSMWEAYLKVSALLEQMGEEDGGHEGCGASKGVESSVANPIAPELLVPAMGLFVPTDEYTTGLITRNAENKRQRLEDGFYGNWDPSKHADYLIEKWARNFSYLEVDPHDHETAGHNASAIYAVGEENAGLAKNAFVADTGQWVFGLTPRKMRQLADMLGGSSQERDAIMVGFADDVLHVSAGLVRKDMPVFA